MYSWVCQPMKTMDYSSWSEALQHANVVLCKGDEKSFVKMISMLIFSIELGDFYYPYTLAIYKSVRSKRVMAEQEYADLMESVYDSRKKGVMFNLSQMSSDHVRSFVFERGEM